ncbi:hypothetical protein AVEN_122371-1, partial [Araneus ventricosus]
MKESLGSLVAKYIPGHFEDLDRRCISFSVPQTVQPEIIRKDMVKAKERILAWKERSERNRPKFVVESVLNW